MAGTGSKFYQFSINNIVLCTRQQQLPAFYRISKQKLKCRKYKAKKHAATLRDNSVSHKTLASGRVQLLPGQLGIKAVHTMRLWAAYVTN